MIRDFIETVLGETEGRSSIWWRPRGGENAPINRAEWFDYPAQLDEMVEFAESIADKDVYLPVAVYDSDSRVPKRTTQVAALWNDTDTFDPDEYRIQPSIVVETSEGRTHCWWLLDRPADAKQAETVVRKLTYAHKGAGADVSSWGRNKLLRLPGTTNTSHGSPQRVTIRKDTGAIYTLAEIANAYDDIPLTPIPEPREMSSLPVGDIPENLPDFFEAQAKLPEEFPIELLTAEPQGGNRSELRWLLLSTLIENGLTNEEAFVIAKQSPAASKWFEDSRGLTGLWAEILKERERFGWGKLEGAEPAEPVKVTRKRVEILTPEERERAQKHYKKTFLHEYEEWVSSHLKVYNAPYHRAAAWMVLSNLVGENARVNVRSKDVPCGLFFFVLGETSTGKSESKDFMQDAIHRGYPEAKNPDIGDDISIGALMDILRDRPRSATIMSSDEVDGMLSQMRDKNGWRSADMATYTYLYDGKVSGQGRKGNTDDVGKWTKTQFSWFGMGTPAKVFPVLDRAMFESGFLARFQWWFGDAHEISESDMGVEIGGESSYNARGKTIEKWKIHAQKVSSGWGFRRMNIPDEDVPIMDVDRSETAEFIKQKTAQIEARLWRDDPNYDILYPSLRRTMITVAKMAALLALWDQRQTFGKDDVLVALLQSEELLANLYYAASQVSTSQHAKMLDVMYDYIAISGQDTPSEKIFRWMSEKHNLDMAQVERYRDELRAHGRISFVQTGASHSWKATAVKEA